MDRFLVSSHRLGIAGANSTSCMPVAAGSLSMSGGNERQAEQPVGEAAGEAFGLGELGRRTGS